MTTTIQKWGNSQGIRLPKSILIALKWSVDEKIEIKTLGNKIVIEPVEDKKRKTITELFDGYNSEYTPEEIDWGKPKGREVW
ncbi:MAG: AbrB/MazE/SpoVT family DNA-binding domain-containing protein [Lachnospiraceae bacterium]|nr:AbrB/MazE/SpoVT family DNA-binding domain-containing protein [Lachnospiraceae bacterium]